MFCPVMLGSAPFYQAEAEAARASVAPLTAQLAALQARFDAQLVDIATHTQSARDAQTRYRRGVLFFVFYC